MRTRGIWMWLACVIVGCGVPLANAANLSTNSWLALFDGIDATQARQYATLPGERTHAVYAIRVDLSNPRVRLFGMPPCKQCGADVVSTTVTRFLTENKLQVAVNCNFFSPNSMVEGTSIDVLGLAISQGLVLTSTNDPAHPAAMLFTTNNTPLFIPDNVPPRASLDGIWLAISGNHVLVEQGSNVAPDAPEVHPRTAMGLTQDERYLVAVVIDGRQPGYSDGATLRETGDWLIRMGAWRGMNLDGGSCSTLMATDCLGDPLSLNRNSNVQAQGHERGVGHIIGFYAPPARGFIRDVSVHTGVRGATMLWETESPAMTRVVYGESNQLDRFVSASTVPALRHVATLSGLERGRVYGFRIFAEAGGQTNEYSCRLSTQNSARTGVIVPFQQVWMFTTNSLDGVQWQAAEFDDSGWLGSGPGPLCVETNGSAMIPGTRLPPSHGNPIPRTYYFRTHFSFEGDPAHATLQFSNYLDDGAVFYLNGHELRRVRMPLPPAVITYATLAGGYACSNSTIACTGDACRSCPDLFTAENLAAILVPGDNVLAAEVHNYAAGSLDVYFGTEVTCIQVEEPSPTLGWLQGEGTMTLYWNEPEWQLQETVELGNGTAAPWDTTNLLSPVTVTNSGGSRFFRLGR